MGRFWLFGGRICLLAAFAIAQLGGCSGRSIEGSWEGPLPDVSEKTVCQIRMSGGRFDFATVHAPKITGGGKYTLSGDRLTLTPELVRYEGHPLKRLPEPRDYWLSGTGNRMYLDLRDGGEPVLWERRKL